MKSKVWVLAICVILAVLLLVLSQSLKAYSGVPDTENARQIQDTIVKSYQIEDAAARDFDTSLFPTVFVNDPRGGELSPSTIDLVRDYNKDATSNYIGYLDSKLAYYSWWEQGALRLEELWAKAAQEGRHLTREEMNSLMDSGGRLAAPRLQGPVPTPEIRFISISVKGDLAIATFDDGGRTIEMTLVKINGQWYIAGNKVIDVHI
jgi:hypothetical protein